MPLVPTSGPLDSYDAYELPRIGPDSGGWVQNIAVPGKVSIQTGLIVRAPVHTYLNPEFYMAAELPRQPLVAAIGAPPVPYASPNYLAYQATPLYGNDGYSDLISGYAPRPSAGFYGQVG